MVSRTVIERDTGTVTLFAFDKGQGLSEHTVPFDALVHVIDGEALVTMNSSAICRIFSKVALYETYFLIGSCPLKVIV